MQDTAARYLPRLFMLRGHWIFIIDLVYHTVDLCCLSSCTYEDGFILGKSQDVSFNSKYADVNLKS